MRLLVILLVLANIAWFAWDRWVAQPAGDAPVRRADAPRLVLASEAPLAAPGRHGPTQQPAINCLSLGPFIELTDAARASTLLRESGFTPRQRAGEGVVWRGFWVSLAGVSNRGEADGIIERLRRFGIGDAYVLPDDEAEGAGVTISLGLFTENERALRRVDEVKALGLEPALAERDRSGTVYWIDVEAERASQLPDPSRFTGSAGRILRLEIQACGAEAQGSQPVPEVANSGAKPS